MTEPLLNSICVLIATAPMQDQLGRVAIAIRHIRDLRVNRFQEKVLPGFGANLELRLLRAS